MNVITKKVTSWPAIVAVPTFITGFYGMNVPYPGFDKVWGFLLSIASMIVIAIILYIIFKKEDWIETSYAALHLEAAGIRRASGRAAR